LGYARPRVRFCVFPALIVVLFGGHAAAQSNTVPPSGERTLGDGAPAPQQVAAREHFNSALALYRSGKYRAAVAELSAALVLDPAGKDLMFNLALVQEKLGDLTGAVHSLEHFQTMETDPKELDRAAQTIQRLQGALAEQRAATIPASGATQVAPREAARPHGKFDGWVAGVGSLSLVSLVAGTLLGVHALTVDSKSDARDAAVLADIALATAVVSGLGTAALYFGRDADPAQVHAGPIALPRMSLARLELRF